MFDYANDLTVSCGDVLDHVLTTRLPKVKGKKDRIRKCLFSDQIQPAIKFNDDVKIAVYMNEKAAIENDLDEASVIWDSKKYYKAKICKSWFRKKTPELKIKIRRAGLKEINHKYNDCYLVAFYTGTVKENMYLDPNPTEGTIIVSTKPTVCWI